MTRALRGVPGLLGVLTGILLFAAKLRVPCYVPPLVLLGLVFAAKLVSADLFTKHPRVALVLLEPWVLAAVCMTALSTQVVLWVTIAAPSWFALEQGELKAVTGALVGAVTAFLATAWTSELKEAEGPFLPATAFKQFARRFAEKHDVTGDDQYVDACTFERVRGDGPQGWGLRARWGRAKLLSEYLATP